MKKAFSSLRTYMIGLGLFLGAFIISFGIYWITFGIGKSTWDWRFIMLAFGTLFLLAAIVIREYNIGRWRKKQDEFDMKLPQDVKDHIWRIVAIPGIAFVYTFVFTGIIVLITSTMIANGYQPPLWLTGGNYW